MFFNLIKVIILIINGIAILSEERFLARIGWSALPPQAVDPYAVQMGMGGGDPTSVKAKLINLISAVRMLMRIPLIGINTIIILYELILG
ncbi:Yos1-like protein [Terfezia boudieri ATCC MYA-4762]|uniref:Yos1-like protein n=1 Tax=Terfezia boudieri ATCC MYA-4762 TaxID=1051890 RepID=A0A3N4LW19_9PEZI|nr:Yos1-like protein [Terfezia boudieri ATCC MYA-4762]